MRRAILFTVLSLSVLSLAGCGRDDAPKVKTGTDANGAQSVTVTDNKGTEVTIAGAGGSANMPAGAETIATIADHWLAQFERAVAQSDNVLLRTLFHRDSHWRDVLPLTWHIRTVSGLDAILKELKAARSAGRSL